MKLKTISSLEKCFLDEDIDQKKEYKRATMLKNEIFHFCIAYVNEEGRDFFNFKIESEIADYINAERIETVPVRHAANSAHADEFFLRKTLGLYPDLLQPLEQNKRLIVTNQLKALMIEIDPAGNVPAGAYTVKLIFENEKEKYSKSFEIEIIDAKLPEQDLIYTQWFYCDSLADYYETETFGDRHFKIIEDFAKTAVRYGVNMLLTPVFTPPLDTYVGGERRTMQLVKIKRDNNVYGFDFSLLDKWIKMCNRIGVKYFEIPHFFTQWGAKAAPKIMAYVNGEYKRIFGWDTPADGEEYKEFLNVFIPAFLKHMKQNGGADRRCFFHISDEPDEAQLEGFLKAKKIVEPLLEGYPIIDAISSYKLYNKAKLSSPISSTLYIDEFIKNGTENLWAYYCALEAVDNLSNRFISMPSSRNRILGIQLFKYGIKGFLHWGYNFYYNQFSYAFVNPFLCTDGEYFGPAGDEFSVYPGPKGQPWKSLRLEVFYDAIQDIRALSLCERLYGRDYVMSMIEENGKIDFKNYSHNDEYILEVRERVNRAIKEQDSIL